MYELRTENFVMRLDFDNMKNDALSEYVKVLLYIKSDNFSAAANIEFEKYILVSFSDELCDLYEKLEGKALLDEEYGQASFVSFEGNGNGHFMVKGRLMETGKYGNRQYMEFENDIEQSYLKEFCYDLKKGMLRLNRL